MDQSEVLKRIAIAEECARKNQRRIEEQKQKVDFFNRALNVGITIIVSQINAPTLALAALIRDLPARPESKR